MKVLDWPGLPKRNLTLEEAVFYLVAPLAEKIARLEVKVEHLEQQDISNSKKIDELRMWMWQQQAKARIERE